MRKRDTTSREEASDVFDATDCPRLSWLIAAFEAVARLSSAKRKAIRYTDDGPATTPAPSLAADWVDMFSLDADPSACWLSPPTQKESPAEVMTGVELAAEGFLQVVSMA